ncbi:hypothetical protein Trydic_g22785 [Trypoxylus dichotomus]
MTSKNALDIPTAVYGTILKRIFKHDLYPNCFKTTQKIKEGDPSLDDFIRDIETLTISLPYPISEPREIESFVDSCNKLVSDKEKYNSKVDSVVSRYKKDKRWLTKKYVKETKYGMLPKYVFDLAMENIKDPDIYFDGNYNWYYTGGVLDKCEIFGEDYLIFTNTTNLLCMRNATGKGYSIKVDVMDESPIVNINTNCNENPIVCLRQRHNICCLELKTIDDELTYSLLMSKRSSPVPFIDIKYHNKELDLRQLDVVKTWAHMLAYPPSMMKIEDYNNNELMFVSSQSYKDRIVLLDNENGSNLVQAVPNNMETWNKCNRIYNFNLFNNNVMRLKCSTIGISFFQNYGGLDLYSCNSVGDIFKNTISPNDNSSVEPLKHINKWMNSLPTKPKELIVSHVRELSHIKDILERTEEPDDLGKYTQDNKKRLELLSEMTLEDVDMATIWLPAEKQESEDLLPSTSSLVKVTEWLNKYEDEVSEEEVKIK